MENTEDFLAHYVCTGLNISVLGRVSQPEEKNVGAGLDVRTSVERSKINVPDKDLRPSYDRKAS